MMMGGMTTPEKELVIVTGSSGFIGSALVNKLAGRFALVGFDRAVARQPPPAAECVCIDLTSEQATAATGQPYLHLDDLTDALGLIIERRKSGRQFERSADRGGDHRFAPENP